MSAEPKESRFAFPYPTETMADLRKSLLWLLIEGGRYSIAEFRERLNTQKEIGARLRELRRPEFGAWPISDARASGPDPDGVFRYELKRKP